MTTTTENPVLPDKEPKATLAKMKEISKAAGNHFFDKDTMKFFCSKIHGGPRSHAGLWYFITSEQQFNRDSPHRYTVRAFNPLTCHQETIKDQDFQQHASLIDARQALKTIIKQ